MKKILLIFLFFSAALAKGQDPQFSQYYSAPLLLNPALTGSGECYRVGLNGRTQWTGLQKAYTTAAAFADLNYEDLRSGFGIMVLHDKAGHARLTSNEFSGFYSYMAPFSKNFNVRFGLQGSYVSRSINYSPLVFEDQYTGTQITTDATYDPVSAHEKISYFDASAGLILFGEDRYWLGFSAHHLNRPENGFYLKNNRLPVKYSLHGGINFYTRKKHRHDEPMRIIPTFMYKSQAKFDQADLGVYIIESDILFGAWYRGIFTKKDEGVRNNDAIVIQLGMQLDQFSIIYSFDYTISRLAMKNTHGSHEISLLYNFCLDWPPKKKPHRKARRLPCPDFQRSTR